MRWPPVGWEPQAWSVRNGAPARAIEAREVDRASTWQAVRKPHHPTCMGLFVSGTTYHLHAIVPPFTRHVAFEAFCTGRGTVTYTSGDDAWNAVTEAWVGDGVTQTIEDAQIVATGPPLSTGGANGKDRSLAVTFRRSWRKVRFTWAIADEGGGKTLRVYAVTLRWLWPDETGPLTDAV